MAFFDFREVSVATFGLKSASWEPKSLQRPHREFDFRRGILTKIGLGADQLFLRFFFLVRVVFRRLRRWLRGVHELRRPPQDRPQRPQELPKIAPRAAKSTPRAPKSAPRSPQERPKTAHDRPKTTPRPPKIAPRSPKTTPRPPKIAPKTKFSSKKVSKKESQRIRNLETHGCYYRS